MLRSRSMLAAVSSNTLHAWYGHGRAIEQPHISNRIR